MITKLNTVTGNVKGLAAAGVFVLALLMPVFLCSCGDTAECDALLLSASAESETAQTLQETGEAVQESGSSEEAGKIYVYICGAVENPGVYQADSGSRLFEILELAGGFTPEADQNGFNLARTVIDGEQFVVLTKEEAARKMTAVSENAAAQQNSGLVNINTATLSELTQISGIGESRAQAIIAYREKHGAFGSVEEIKKVDGIKDGLFSKIKDFITV